MNVTFGDLGIISQTNEFLMCSGILLLHLPLILVNPTGIFSTDRNTLLLRSSLLGLFEYCSLESLM